MATVHPEMYRERMQEVALGMVLLGVIFSSGMFGIMLTQAYKYYRRFKKDSITVKLVVLAVVVLNTVSMFFVGHAAWYYLVTTGPRTRSVWSLNAELALSIIMSGLSETFLAFRAFKLSGNKYWLAAVLFSLVSLHFTSGEVAAMKLLLLGKEATFTTVKVPTYLRLGSAALCDTSIAISLCYFLHKKRTGFKRSDEIINYLMLFSINSGLLTSVVSIASLITYIVIPRTWVYTALCFLISRLYATTFLCSLNSRQILLNNNQLEDDTDEKHPPIRVGGFRPGRSNWSVVQSVNGGNSPTQIDVFVVTETVTDGLGSQISPSGKITKTNKHTNDIRENSSRSTLAETSASDSGSSCRD